MANKKQILQANMVSVVRSIILDNEHKYGRRIGGELWIDQPPDMWDKDEKDLFDLVTETEHRVRQELFSILKIPTIENIKRGLKLYVWEDVLSDYTSGIAFAYATDPERARELILEKMGYKHEDLSTRPREVKAEEGFYVYGGM